MKIGILVGYPTQFEGPFYRYAAQDENHEIRILYMDPTQVAQIFDPELGRKLLWGIDLLSGYSYSVLPRSHPERWLLHELRSQRYDLLIVNTYTYRACFAAILMAYLLGTPVALRVDSVMLESPPFAKLMLKKVLFRVFDRFCNHFFAISNWTVDYLKYFRIRQERIAIFTYAIDVDYFRQRSCLVQEARLSLKERYHIPETNRVLLSVAKFNDREAPWDLLKAFCTMDRGALSLLLVGDGEQRDELERYARDHLDGEVVFAGYVPYTDLPAHYAIADVFIHPARTEPWGVSVAEALACGLPVIASSRVGAGRDLICCGRNGDVYEWGNSEDLARKLVDALALNSSDVLSESERILSQWDYAATWGNILSVASRYLQERSGERRCNSLDR